MIIKNIIPDLFTFPIVMVDGENEERKEKQTNLFAKPGEEPEIEYDIIYGEACYPYYDFRGFEDRWLPTQRSLDRAMNGKFDSCMVRFDNAGSYLVPLSKEKFLKNLTTFINKRQKETDIPVLPFPPVKNEVLSHNNREREEGYSIADTDD